ncbi:MAG: FliI/YscN family ATPase [Thermaerobacter sp.]|nr:FliI/YscN family ATPase [Thermaerobacter sp.]
MPEGVAFWEHLARSVRETDPILLHGRVDQVIGLTIESHGPTVSLGELCHLQSRGGAQVPAEVVGFRGSKVILMPLGEMEGIGPGSEVVASGTGFRVGVGPALAGRVLDALGRPIDDRGPLAVEELRSAQGLPPAPLKRQRITSPLSLGVRSVDGLLTCGRGQRVGIFSGTGVGKSTFLGMIARNTEAERIVIALVGERGREVREFLEKDLGSGLKRSTVVVATSDQPALVRIKAALAATAIAEYYRDQGMDVVLLMDSVTRFAMAQREVGLAVGEPPTTRGYPPSVFGLLPRLLERSGTGERGTITGFYNVLVDGDDLTEPVADAVRGILDGHIVLSRELANRGIYPAVDLLQSVSRVMPDVVEPWQGHAADAVREVLATWREAEDLINIGAYAPGSNPRIDRAQRLIERVWDYLRQGTDQRVGYADAQTALRGLLDEGGVAA